MTPEERKAIAMRQSPPRPCVARCQLPGHLQYPKCCSYHEGFDDALSLLVDDDCREASVWGGTHYRIEPPSEAP